MNLEDVISTHFPHLAQALNRYKDEHLSRAEEVHDEYWAFRSTLRFFSNPDSWVSPVTRSHVTLMSVCGSGAVETEICCSPSALNQYFRNDIDSHSLTRNVLDFLNQRQVNVKSRIFVVNDKDDLRVELIFMDLLQGLFGLDLLTLWHVFHVRQYWLGEDRSRIPTSPPLEEHVLSSWTSPQVFSLGKISLIVLDGKRGPLPNNIPTAIIFPNQGQGLHGAYHDDPLSKSYDQARHEQLERGLNSLIVNSVPFLDSDSAKSAWGETKDELEALLSSFLEKTDEEKADDPTLPCIKFMLQYHMKASRFALADHLQPLEGYILRDWKNTISVDEHIWVPETSHSWQRVQRLLQHLEQQRVATQRFLSSLHASSSDLNEELREWQLLIEELRVVVEHKRQRLDHQLNNTLLRESRANLKVAHMAMNEGRGTKLLTTLAFIFVPFSLATSIFGMNIQELNQNGQSINTFLLTLFVLLISAICVWAFAVTINCAFENFKQRTVMMRSKNADVDQLWREMLKGALAHPGRAWTVASKGMGLGVLTGGRYDFGGFFYAYQILCNGERSVTPSWKRGRLFEELRYFLGLRRLLGEEEFKEVW